MTIHLNSKKNRLCILLIALMESRSYHKDDLDKLISHSISPQYLNQPMYAVDHLRRALVDNGYMIKDPKTEVYTLKQGVQSLQELHKEIEQELLIHIENAPNQKIDCKFCEKKAKPVAMLNHYRKKHCYIAMLNALKKEFCPTYISC